METPENLVYVEGYSYAERTAETTGNSNLGASYGKGKLNLPAVERYDVDGLRLPGPHHDPSLFFSL